MTNNQAKAIVNNNLKECKAKKRRKVISEIAIPYTAAFMASNLIAPLGSGMIYGATNSILKTLLFHGFENGLCLAIASVLILGTYIPDIDLNKRIKLLKNLKNELNNNRNLLENIAIKDFEESLENMKKEKKLV